MPAQIDAIEEIIQREKFDVVAISGDLSQRSRAGEFQRAAVFLRDTGRVSRIICIPGNHDVAWWHAPFGIGWKNKLYENYSQFISSNLEPVLQVTGATFVGVNTSHGVTLRTLTWNLRDISIIGDIREEQFAQAEAAFNQSPPESARVIVMHHNPVKGELSQRHGLKDTRRVLGLSLSAALNAPIPETRFGVFRM